MPKAKEPTTLPEVALEFGKAHKAETTAKTQREKWRKRFFDLITFRSDELARQTIFYEGDDLEGYVATLYPKWRIVSSKGISEDNTEVKVVIEEDPDKKGFVFINPLDKKVYSRTVSESAPQLDMERLKAEDPHLWQSVTEQPPLPERVLKPLSKLNEDEKDGLKKFLTPPKLTPTMQAPRKATPEELEEIG